MTQAKPCGLAWNYLKTKAKDGAFGGLMDKLKTSQKRAL